MDSIINKPDKSTDFELVVLDKKGTENKYPLEQGKELVIGDNDCEVKVHDELLANNRFSIIVNKNVVKAKKLLSGYGLQFLNEKSAQIFPNQFIFKGKENLMYFQQKI